MNPGYQVHTACFAAGTPVWTRAGRVPIESLKVGDVVLSQNVETGALSYQPVMVVHHNPPAETLRITVGGEVLVSSELHRFWVAGKGWSMARDLRTGTELRNVNGVERITAIEPDRVQPVFNLDVGQNRSFFVGDSGVLVHDHSLPGTRVEPFDARPELASAIVED